MAVPPLNLLVAQSPPQLCLWAAVTLPSKRFSPNAALNSYKVVCIVYVIGEEGGLLEALECVSTYLYCISQQRVFGASEHWFSSLIKCLEDLSLQWKNPSLFNRNQWTLSFISSPKGTSVFQRSSSTKFSPKLSRLSVSSLEGESRDEEPFLSVSKNIQWNNRIYATSEWIYRHLRIFI